MCFSGIPLGYGMVAWITGNERANMIEIELLAFNKGTLNLKHTELTPLIPFGKAEIIFSWNFIV